MEEGIIFLDRLLPLYTDMEFSSASDVNLSTWTEQDRTYVYQSDLYLRKLLLSFRYAIEKDNGNLELTDIGRNAKKAGGHFAYLKQLSEKAAAESERLKLNDEKLRLDLKNSKRIFKSYWWTFAFALVSFIYVLIQIVLKISEVIKPNLHK